MVRSVRTAFTLTLSICLLPLFSACSVKWPPPDDTPPDALVTVEITTEPEGVEIWSVKKTHELDVDWGKPRLIGKTPYRGLTAFYIHPKKKHRIALLAPDKSAKLFHYSTKDKLWVIGGKSKSFVTLEFELRKKGMKTRRIKEDFVTGKALRLVGFTDSSRTKKSLKKLLNENKHFKRHYDLGK